VLAAALSHSSGPPRITAIAQLLSGQIAQRRGRPEQSLPHLTAARRLAGATAQPEVRAAALTAVAGLQLQHDDDPATAESSVREALSVARRHGAESAEAEALFMLATI